MGTRSPADAQFLARVLAVSGQTALAQPKVRVMRYDKIREHVRNHFIELLARFNKKSAERGPSKGLDLDALRSSLELAQGNVDHWATQTHYDGASGLLRDFCASRDIDVPTTEQKRDLLLAELQKGNRAYLKFGPEHIAKHNTIDLDRAGEEPLDTEPTLTLPTSEGVLALEEVLSQYLDEQERTNALAPKIEGEKRDALALMAELTEHVPPAHMTKAHAQNVKAALFKLPKNRSKNTKTRDLPLSEALEVPDVERIADRTMNVYLGHMQHFFGWAVNNGYAAENVFHGLRLRRTVRGSNEGRKAFSTEQLQLMFKHLTDPASLLVKKGAHKWPALTAMFTGMRLNEVAQLEVQDVELLDGVWCINVAPDGENHKRLKNASSKRRVPVHRRLEACGFLDLHSTQKDAGQTRLLPSLTYSPQNAYECWLSGSWRC